ncbi:MAG: DNA-3-methyladenine glycosylase 2 family protein [Actinobacteria bacterium]|nr:DNA-3-methyladenine glycosylase 2 family protein [Actinomycetota bacterium]
MAAGEDMREEGRRFTIVPRGEFSLEAAANFGFGPRKVEATASGSSMRMAFCADGYKDHAGVVLHQDSRGVHGDVAGNAGTEVVRNQVARVLSLDHDGDAWLNVGNRDPVMDRLQRTYMGVRPVLFYSPYEAACWSIISARRSRAQALEVHIRLSAEYGAMFTLEGEDAYAWPTPQRMLELEPLPGLPEERLRRLQGVATAALEGKLDPAALCAADPARAMGEMLNLRGIGPFYAELIVVRATGVTDVLPAQEPKARVYAARFYGMDAPPNQEAFEALAEPWRPFRTWAAVLIRVAGDSAPTEI